MDKSDKPEVPRAEDRRRGKGGLRRRLTAAFFLVGLVPAAIGGILTLRYSLRATQEAQAEIEEHLITLAAEAVTDTLLDGLEILRAAAQDAPLQRAVSVGDRPGLLAQLRAIAGRYSHFASVKALDPAGVCLADTLDAGAAGKSFQDRDYFRGALTSGAPYVSSIPYIGAATRVPTLALSTPIRGPGGQVLGVLAGSFTLEHLSRLVAPPASVSPDRLVPGTDQGSIYLVSPSGLILAHSRPEHRMTRVAPTDAGARAALAGHRGSVAWADASGRMQSGVFAPLPRIGWGLVHTRPSPSWLTTASALVPGVLPILAVVLAAAALAGAVAARTLSRPITDLEQAASRLSEGEFSARLPQERRDELGDLAISFNQMAAALQDLYTTQETKVTEQTAALKATNLELARASQVKSEFLARTSHDLRTHLNAIIGFVDLILTQQVGVLNDKQRRYLGHVASAGRHLLALVNDILDLTRVEAGRLEIHPESCELAPILEETLALFRSAAQVRRVNLAVEIGTPLGQLTADRIRVQQIIHNLLSNAVKFTPEGGMITIGARQIGLEVEITVRDTGIGIPVEDQQRIFEMYEQAGNTEGRQKGSGLGLAITKRLVELHGGTIRVESTPGQGSTFIVRLPGASPIDAGPEGSDASRPLVLVIEDDLRAAELIRGHLVSGGYRVALVASGRAGLGAAKRLQPRAITLDLGLPDLDGWEVLHRLKNDPATQGIPVLIVSAREHGQVGLSLGAMEWLTKPVDPQRLLAALQRRREPGVLKRAMRILVVDDEPEVLDALEMLLRREGHEVFCASDGEAALRQAEAEHPEIILLDLHLPGLSGFEVVSSLRLIPGLESLPVIAFSGKFVSPEERSLLTRQAVQFVGKYGPVTLNRLLEDLRRISSLAN